MSTQYTDGTWSDTEALPQAVDTFNDALAAGVARKLVVGSPDEIEAEQAKDALADHVSDLQNRMDELEGRQDQSLIAIPTAAELQRFGE